MNISHNARYLIAFLSFIIVLAKRILARKKDLYSAPL